MKISYKGDYALKAILDLVRYSTDGTVVPLADVSKRQNIPVKYLEQIMLILKKAGYVDSKRGIGGGFFLLRQADQITLGEIVRLIEGPIEPIACAKEVHDESCGEEDACAFREVWLKAAAAMSAIVDHVTFADIQKRTEELQVRGTFMYQI